MDMKRCNFNARHLVRTERFDDHIRKCPDRMIIFHYLNPNAFGKIHGDLNFPVPSDTDVAFSPWSPSTLGLVRALFKFLSYLII